MEIKSRISKYAIFFALPVICGAFVFAAGTKRALLVGINNYHPAPSGDLSPKTSPAAQANIQGQEKAAVRGSFSDLGGPLNDVRELNELLVAKFGFKPTNIKIIPESLATKKNILDEIRKQLVDPVRPGDVCFFYYSGHGSQIKNISSAEPDKMDETLVPADTSLGEWDIRDKELARLFNQCLDKGGVLTAILDSCHSGSAARGLAGAERNRSAPPDVRVIDDPPDAAPTPEKRGALIISAAQDFESAQEKEMKIDDRKVVWHGVFTYALLQTLSRVSVREPVSRVFDIVWAKLNANGWPQKPVIEGTAERKMSPLFGTEAAEAADKVIVPVILVKDDFVLLQGGAANGLNPRCELKKIQGQKKDGDVRIRITKVIGLSRSEGKVISGDIGLVQAGDQFELDLWAPPDRVSLDVWLPPSNLEEAKIDGVARKWAGLLAGSSSIQWVEDPTADVPTHVISWSGEEWILEEVGSGKPQRLGKDPAPESALRILAGFSGVKPRLFLYIPPSADLAAPLRLRLGPNTGLSAIDISPKKGFAPQYHLVGRMTGKEHAPVIEYAWVLANQTQKNSGKLALPVRTDWLKTGKELSGELEERVLRIAKIRGWLDLDSPLGSQPFPYSLALVNSKTGRILTEGTAVEGEVFGLVLVSDKEPPVQAVTLRYVYVFSIDKDGNGKLLYPPASVENRFPPEIETKKPKYSAKFQLGPESLFRISKPFGLDTYILLTTTEPLPNPEVLNFSGVRSRGEEKGLGDPLSELLNDVGSGSRGDPRCAPTSWSVQRLMIRSVPQSTKDRTEAAESDGLRQD